MKRYFRLSLVVLWLLTVIGTARGDGALKSAEKLNDTGEYKASIRLLKKITKQEPLNAGAWTLMGNSFLRLGKSEKAVNAFEKAITAEPENEEAFFGLGLAYGKMRQYTHATEAFKRAVTIDPQHANAHF